MAKEVSQHREYRQYSPKITDPKLPRLSSCGIPGHCFFGHFGGLGRLWSSEPRLGIGQSPPSWSFCRSTRFRAHPGLRENCALEVSMRKSAARNALCAPGPDQGELETKQKAYDWIHDVQCYQRRAGSCYVSCTREAGPQKGRWWRRWRSMSCGIYRKCWERRSCVCVYIYIYTYMYMYIYIYMYVFLCVFFCRLA